MKPYTLPTFLSNVIKPNRVAQFSQYKPLIIRDIRMVVVPSEYKTSDECITKAEFVLCSVYHKLLTYPILRNCAPGNRIPKNPNHFYKSKSYMHFYLYMVFVLMSLRSYYPCKFVFFIN